MKYDSEVSVFVNLEKNDLFYKKFISISMFKRLEK